MTGANEKAAPERGGKWRDPSTRPRVGERVITVIDETQRGLVVRWTGTVAVLGGSLVVVCSGRAIRWSAVERWKVA